jgi:predicted outer membrane repeat protein
MLATHSSRRAAMSALAVLAFAALLGTFVRQAAATTIRVPADQPTLQSGINATVSGDTVLVSAGTYAGLGNHDLDFDGRNIVFRSVAGAINTIISVSGPGRGFSFTSGETPLAVVDGFTVQGGLLLRSPAEKRSPKTVAKSGSNNGAAMLCISSSPTIRNCRFVNGIALGGGGVYVMNATITFQDCVFSNNRAGGDGGGILAETSSLHLVHCTFLNNRAGEGDVGRGGGVSSDSGWLIAEDCTFNGNQVQSTGDDSITLADGGGIYASGVISLTSCTFESNAALATNDDTQVGNIARGGGAMLLGSDAVLSDCIFLKNSVESSSGIASLGANQSLGGGLFCEGAVLNGCTIGQSTASAAGSPLSNTASGGGVHSADAVFIDCLIKKNVATATGDTLVPHIGEGGGVSIGASAHLVGCTLSANSASTTGGGIYMRDSWIFRVERTIIVGSTAGGAIACFGAASPFITCCDFFGNTGGDWAGCIAGQGGSLGNQSADPLFCDIANSNYGLDSHSPCAPGNSPLTCGLIGALPVSCGLIDVADFTAPTAPEGASLVPNPIGNTGLLQWHNPSAGQTNLRLYDATGRLVMSRELGHGGHGRQRASWSQVTGGESVPAGVYFLRVQPPASEEQVVRVVVTR